MCTCMLSVTHTLLPLNHLIFYWVQNKIQPLEKQAALKDISCSCILPIMSTCNQVHGSRQKCPVLPHCWTLSPCPLTFTPSSKHVRSRHCNTNRNFNKYLLQMKPFVMHFAVHEHRVDLQNHADHPRTTFISTYYIS